MSRQRQTEQQRPLLMEWLASGLSAYDFAQSHGIRPGSLYNWRRRHAKYAADDGTGGLSVSLPPAEAGFVAGLVERCARSGSSTTPAAVVAKLVKYCMNEDRKKSAKSRCKWPPDQVA